MVSGTPPHAEKTILLVDGDKSLQQILIPLLEAEGWRISVAAEPSEASVMVSAVSIDLILIADDPMLALEFTRRVRAGSDLPIIFLAHPSRESVKLNAFDAGADDFVTVPFSSQELTARISAKLTRAARRRHTTADVDNGVYRFGALQVDAGKRKVEIDGRAVRITPTEFRLLMTFVRNAGRVLATSFIQEMVWGDPHAKAPEYVRTCIYRLRRKLKLAEQGSPYFVSFSGVGYMFTGGRPSSERDDTRT